MHLSGSYTVPGPVPGAEQNSRQNWLKSLPSGGLHSNEQIFHNSTTYTKLKFIVWAIAFLPFLFAFMCVFLHKIETMMWVFYT